MKAKTKAYATGIFLSISKRAVFIFLILIILQIINLQMSTARQSEIQDTKAEERLREALDENRKEHAKTQRYLRCIVLLPVEERTEDNFAKCGETGVVNPSIDDQEASGSSATPVQSQPPVVTASTGEAHPQQQTPSTSAPPDPKDPPKRNRGIIRPLIDPTLGRLDVLARRLPV